MEAWKWMVLVALAMAAYCADCRAAGSDPVDVCADTTLKSAEFYKTIDTLAARENAQATITTYFVPAGKTSRFLVTRAHDKDTSYRVFIQRDPQHAPLGGVTDSALLTGTSVIAGPIPAADPLVQKGDLSAATTTIVMVRTPSELADLWTPAVFYIFGCKDDRVQFVSTASAPLSPHGLSFFLACAFVALAYILIAIAMRLVNRKLNGGRLSELGSLRFLDPVVLTADAEGKASASTLQILIFSCVVVGLLAFIMMRTGQLFNLSDTILLLLGISAVGATASKATDATKNRLKFENWAWLIQKNWLPQYGQAAINTPRWRDIVTTDGKFDVYRFQMLMFSVLVAGALLTGPWQDLASFSIPENLLGILGLSQAVYIGGKLAAPPTMGDLDNTLSKLRTMETAFRDAAVTKPDPTPTAPSSTPPPPPKDLSEAIRRAGRGLYDAYMEQAKLARQMFESVIDKPVAPEHLEPGFE